MYGKCKGRRKWARILAPTNLQTAVVQSKTLIGGHLEERECRGGINEGNELDREIC